MRSRDKHFYPNIHPNASATDFYPNGKLLSDEQIAAIENLEEKQEGRYTRKYLAENGIHINRGGIIKLSDKKTGQIVLYATYKTHGNFGKKSIVLGEGTYGKVKLIQNLHTGNFHALKILKPHPNPIIVTEFMEEAAINNMLNRGEPVVFEKIKTRKKTPSSVNFDRKYYAIQDYFPGVDLHSAIAKPSLNLLDRIKIAIKIVEELTFVHQHNLIHCDIKTDNIRYNPQSQMVRIIDFGGAMASNKGFTGLKGTPIYLSPEIIAKYDYSEASDNFALGRVFKELFAIKEMINIVLPPKLKVIHQVGKHGIKYVEALTQEEQAIHTNLTNLTNTMTALEPSARPNLESITKTLVELQSQFANIAHSMVENPTYNKIFFSPHLLDYIWQYAPNSIIIILKNLQIESIKLNLEANFTNITLAFLTKNNLPPDVLENIMGSVPGLELSILNVYPTENITEFVKLLNQIKVIQILDADPNPAAYDSLYVKIISLAIEIGNKQQLIEIINFLEKKKIILRKEFYGDILVQLQTLVKQSNYSLLEPMLGTRFLTSVFTQNEILNLITNNDLAVQQICRNIFFNTSPQNQPIYYTSLSNPAKNILMLLSHKWLDSNNNNFREQSKYSLESEKVISNLIQNMSQLEMDAIFAPLEGMYISQFRADPLHIISLNYQNFIALFSKLSPNIMNLLIDRNFVKLLLSVEPIDTTKLTFVIEKIGNNQFITLLFSIRIDLGEHFFDLLAIKEIEVLITALKLQNLYHTYFSLPVLNNKEIFKAIANINHDELYQYLKTHPELLNDALLQALPSLALVLNPNSSTLLEAEVSRLKHVFKHPEKSMNNSPQAFIKLLARTIHPNAHRVALPDKMLPILKTSYSTLTQYQDDYIQKYTINDFNNMKRSLLILLFKINFTLGLRDKDSKTKMGYFRDALQFFSKVTSPFNLDEKEQYLDFLIVADSIPITDKISVLLKLMLGGLDPAFIQMIKEKVSASSLSKNDKTMLFDSISSIDNYPALEETKANDEEKTDPQPNIIPLDHKSVYQASLLTNTKFAIIQYVLDSEAGLNSTAQAPSHLSFFSKLWDHLTGINAGICYLTLLNNMNEKLANASVLKEIILYALLLQAGPTLSQRVCHALGIYENSNAAEVSSAKAYLHSAITEKIPSFIENQNEILVAINNWVKTSNPLLTAERKFLQKESGDEAIYWHYFKSHMQDGRFPLIEQIVAKNMQKSPKPKG